MEAIVQYYKESGERTTKFSETYIIQIGFLEAGMAHKFMVNETPPFGLPETLPDEMFFTDLPYPLDDGTS